MGGVTTVVTGVGTALPHVAGPDGLLAGAPAAEPPGDPVAGMTGRGMRYKDRATKLALHAGAAALADAGLLRDSALCVPGDGIGVVVSSNYGNVDTIHETARTIAAHTYLASSPMMLPGTASNVIASWLAITYAMRGPNLTWCNGATSGLDALHWGRTLIAAGRVPIVLLVGVEPDNEPVRELLVCTDPQARKEPVDGAAAVVLEARTSACARGVPALAGLGAYARAGSQAEALAAVRCTAARPIGLLCQPEEPADGLDTTLDTTLGDVRELDLGSWLGVCSGALGVLQCVAGAAWLRAGGRGTVLALAGSGGPDGDDAVAAMLFTPAEDEH